MARRRRAIAMAATALGALLTASLAGVLAWFIPVAKLGEDDLPVSGVTEGAYFAYGDGSKEKPYGIAKPRHLYNLSWLTYLGYFGKQTYFELANDVSMEGWTIPPIGTSEYPFVGNFDGKNHVVSDCSISNLFADYGTKHPGAVTSVNFKSNKVKIVGFFGVVGELADDSYAGAYEPSVNSAYDFGLDGITVKTSSSDTLIGMAAGYVDAELSNIAVSSGSISVASGAGISPISPATNVSEHSIIGFTTKKKEVRRIDESIYAVGVSQDHEFNATAEGDTTGWGGSIDMVSLYQRIRNVSLLASSDAPYKWKNVTTHYVDGSTSDAPSNFSSAGNYSPRRYSGTPAIGNLHYMNRSDDASFRYIGGGNLQIDEYYSYYAHSGKAIYSGSHYLGVGSWSNGGGVSDVAQSDLVLWNVPSNGNSGYISTTYNNQTYYLRNNGGALTVTTSTSNRTTWTVSSQGDDIYNGNYHLTYSGAWILRDTSITYYTVGSGGNYIAVDEGKINSDSAITNVTDINEATLWRKNGNKLYTSIGGTTYYLCFVYYPGSGEYLYLGLGVYTTNDYAYVITDNEYLYSNNSDYPYYLYFDSSSNSWKQNNSSNYASGGKLSIAAKAFSKTVGISSAPTKYGPDNYLDSTRRTSKMNYTATNTTYLPLNVKSDGGGILTSAAAATTKVNNGDYNPKDSNTGYLVSGYYFPEGNTSLSSTNANRAANIRVSQYPTTSISNFNNGLKDENGILDTGVYTINSSGSVVTVDTVASSFEKYGDSKKSFFDNALDGASNVYGLHFMDSKISKADIVPASNISILGESRSNPSTGLYEMPVNAIDFNLKQKGYINFFAATFFSGNNSFFSLHHIERESDTDIKEIKKIEAVYGDGIGSHSYIYKYSDGTYFEPYCFDGVGNKFKMNYDGSIAISDEVNVPYIENRAMSAAEFAKYTHYEPIFYTSQIGVTASLASDYYKRMFYFEIPMNDGEFALGSVEGGTGGYLLYLDIGANAAKTQRTIVSEHFVLTEDTFAYPLGVAFIAFDPEAKLDPSDSASMSIPTEDFSGKSLSVSRSGDTLTIEEDGDVALTGDLTYLGDSIVIDDAIKEKLKPKLTKVTDVKRLEYYDYNVNLGEVVRTIITDTTVGGVTTREVAQHSKSGSSDWAEVAEANWKVYQTLKGTSYSLTDVKSPSSLALDGAINEGGLGWTDPGSATIVTFYYLLDEGVDATQEITLSLEVDEDNTSGQYYAFGGYEILVTSSGGDIVIKILSYGSGSLEINGTTVTAQTKEITVTAS